MHCSRDGSDSPSTRPPLWARLNYVKNNNNNTWNAMDFCVDIHGPQRIFSTDFTWSATSRLTFLALKWNVLTAIRWFAMTFGTYIHVACTTIIRSNLTTYCKTNDISSASAVAVTWLSIAADSVLFSKITVDVVHLVSKALTSIRTAASTSSQAAGLLHHFIWVKLLSTHSKLHYCHPLNEPKICEQLRGETNCF